MTDVVARDTAQRVEILLLDSSNNAVTGASPTLLIRRKSDGQHFTGSAWQSAAATVAMTEVSAAQDPGRYVYTFDTTGLGDDEFYFTADAATGANVPQTGVLRTGVMPIPATLVPFPVGGQAGDPVWTKEEKDRALARLDEIRALAEALGDTEAMEAAIRSKVEVEVRILRDAISSKFDILDSSILKKDFELSYSQSLVQARVALEQRLSESAVKIAEQVAAALAEKAAEIREAMKHELSASGIAGMKKSIDSVEKIVVRTAPTQVLEDIQNEADHE